MPKASDDAAILKALKRYESAADVYKATGAPWRRIIYLQHHKERAGPKEARQAEAAPVVERKPKRPWRDLEEELSDRKPLGRRQARMVPDDRRDENLSFDEMPEVSP